MNEAKKAFIAALAEYLVGDQVKKSIHLQLGKESAVQWSKLRGLTPLHGYPTVEEAQKILEDFLG